MIRFYKREWVYLYKCTNAFIRSMLLFVVNVYKQNATMESQRIFILLVRFGFLFNARHVGIAYYFRIIIAIKVFLELRSRCRK